MMNIRRKQSSLSQIYDEARLDKQTRRSLNCMMVGNMFGNMWGSICAGGSAAMVGLAGMLGADDMVFGLLVAITQVAALMQLPFSALVNRTRKRKIYLLTVGLFSRVLWLFFGFLALLEPGNGPILMLIILLAVSSICSSAINVCWFPWFSDLAPLRIRGRWLSFRDTIISVISLLFGILVAFLLDRLPGSSKYIVIFLLGGGVGIVDMICFGFAKEEWKSSAPPVEIRKTIGQILRNKPFMRFTVMWTAWCFTANLSGAYLTPYSMNSMGLNFMQIMIFGTAAASLSTVFAVPRWGRALDSYGSRNVMMLGAIGASLTPLAYLLAAPGSIWPTFLHNFIGAIFWSGTNLAANSMQLSCSDDDTRPSYIAVFSCVTALAGTALGTMCGGWLLDGWHSAGWFTGGFDRYQALIVLSVVLRFGLSMLLIPRMSNDHEGTLLDVLRSFLPQKSAGR